jgi:hypothetical protein
LPPEPGHILNLKSFEIRQDADLGLRHLLLDFLDDFGFLWFLHLFLLYSSRTRFLTSLVSTGTPGPMVVLRWMPFIAGAFTGVGFSRTRESTGRQVWKFSGEDTRHGA